MHDQPDPADDVEGHRLASNDNEVVVRRPVPPADEEEDVADAADDREAR
jgi:hypothetical protein